jgi:hypothetical protein
MPYLFKLDPALELVNPQIPDFLQLLRRIQEGVRRGKMGKGKKGKDCDIFVCTQQSLIFPLFPFPPFSFLH